MSTFPVASGAFTLADWKNTVDPNGGPATVAELLSQSNEIYDDMLFMEGNLPTGHQASIRTGLPESIWRKLYQGVPASKSLRATVTDSVGILEARNEIDVKVATLNGNVNALRASEGKAFVESMGQTFAETVIYGDSSLTPERFNGLSVRYNTISTGTSEVAKNVISASGSGNTTSVWLVVWSPETVIGIYPKGSAAGLQHEDLGIIDAFDSSNNRFRAYADRWEQTGGIHVKDWRYIVRICNISVSDMLGQTSTQANTASTWLPNLMVKALARIPMAGKGNAVFYASRTTKEMLAVAALNKSNSVLSIQDGFNQFGKVGPGFVTRPGGLAFQGVPVRTVDRILETETALT